MKLLLVIDVADDVAEKYKVFTVDYTLRGDNDKSNDWIDYVQDAKVKVLPQKDESNWEIPSFMKKEKQNESNSDS